MTAAYCPSHRQARLAAAAEAEAHYAKYLVYDGVSKPDSVIKALAKEHKNAYVEAVLRSTDLKEIGEIVACAGCLAARRLQPRRPYQLSFGGMPTGAPLAE